jgi:hypothetical protein
MKAYSFLGLEIRGSYQSRHISIGLPSNLAFAFELSSTFVRSMDVEAMFGLDSANFAICILKFN